MIGHRELAHVVELLRAAARTEIMPRFRKLAAGAIRRKTSDTDLVTDADEAAEAMIAAGLSRAFPGCTIIGEEATAADPTLLNEIANAELAFTVDPIDGTGNYAAGLPLFGVMVAAIMRGEVVASAIYDPVGDDTALALRGEGAWLEQPDGTKTRLHVATPVPPAHMTGVAAWRYMPEPLRSRVARNLTRIAASWDYRCAVHQYRMLAGGHCHFLMYNRLLPWDHLPGVLLHREAGGYVAHFDGSPYRAGDLDGGLLCAADRPSWDAIRHALLDD